MAHSQVPAERPTPSESDPLTPNFGVSGCLTPVSLSGPSGSRTDPGVHRALLAVYNAVLKIIKLFRWIIWSSSIDSRLVPVV